MIPTFGRSSRALILSLLASLAVPALAADAPGPATKRALTPPAPQVPASVVAAMQGGKYPEAIAGLDRLIAQAKEPGPKAYYALVRGTAERLAGRSQDARATWSEAIRVDPKGEWVAKLRFELAAAELAAGRAAPAEELARLEAETLLAGDRKDRLAGVYYAFARRLISPDDPVTPSDPNGAYAMLVQAVGLAKGPALVATLQLEMARAAQAAGNFPHAVDLYRVYLKLPGASQIVAARYAIGECQMRAGQLPAARLTWTDLAADLAKPQPLGWPSPEAAETRARSLYQIAMTHGIPAPPDDAQLNLGVAALKNFLASYPTHPWAVRAAYQIGASYLARGQSDKALAAFTDFLKGDGFRAESDEAKRDLATLSMTASYQVGQVLLGQEKFPQAIAAFRAYLTKFPNGPQSADSQRSILDAELLAADDAIRRSHPAEARTAWLDFVARNPLDARVPSLLFRVGESFVGQEKYDEAIAAWDTLLSKFPGSEPAAHAQFLIASIFEIQRGKPAEAIERFKKVAVDPWAGQARQRVAVMESREMTVITPWAFRSGQTPLLRVSTRNLERLTFTAYKLDAEAYFRKKQALGDVESLDIGLVAADAEWSVPVTGYAKYKPIDTVYELKVKVPGVWVVKVTDETHLQATTLVLGSDIDAILKSSRDQLLVFAQDMKTGKGRPGARVLVSDDSGVILEGKTGADGVLLKGWDKPREPNSALNYLIVDGGDVAGTGLGVPAQVAQGLSARAYIYTDRPAYRPGQPVALRGVVREVNNGQYATPAGASYKLEVYDSRGRLLVARPVTLSAFGTFHETVALDGSAPVGAYRVRVYQPGKSDFAGAFEVQSYRLEKGDVAFDLPKTVYFRGETVKADVIAKYQYGAPLANRPIRVELPDGRAVEGKTDGAGKYHLEFSTSGFAEEQTLRMIARLPQDNLAAVADVSLAVRAFRIDATTTRDLYLDGETFAVKIHTVDALGKPTGQTLTVTPIKHVEQGGRISEVAGKELTVTTDPTTGDASAPLTIDDSDGGPYVIRVAGVDRFKNVVFADRALAISGKKDSTKLRILADRVAFKVGETASVNLHSREPRSTTALVAWEADRVIQYRLVPIKEGDNPLTWAVEGPQFPNFTLTAARMAGSRFDESRLDVRVERDLRVTVKPKRPTVAPGDLVEVEISAVDQSGRPVAAELSMALVDRSLLRVFGDNLPPIGPYFYDQIRTGSFATTGTNTFHYAPATAAVSEAVVEDEAMRVAQVTNGRVAGMMGQAAKTAVVAQNAPAAMPAPAAPGEVQDLSRPVVPRQSLAAPAGGSELAGLLGTGDAAPAAKGAMAGGLMMRDGAMGREKLRRAPSEPGQGQDAKSFGMMPGKDAAGLYYYSDGVEKKSPQYGWAAADKRGEVQARRMFQMWDFQEQAAAEQADPRRRFVETAYWNPAITTGADGKATLTFKAPVALSEYRFTARGITGADTLVGQSTADLIVRKDFFVDLKVPDALTEGDKPRFMAQVHHMGVTGEVTVRLSAYAGERETVFPKTINIKGDGVEEILFDPFEVPEGDMVRLTLSAKTGTKADELVVEVPIRPWGVQAFASASGTSSDDATAFVGLPPGRTYSNPEMIVTVAPSLQRLIIELALGQEAFPITRADIGLAPIAPCPPLPLTIADRAGELIAASAALGYLGKVKGDAAPEAERLTARIRGLSAELVTVQNDDGGWPWVAPTDPQGAKSPSDRMTSTIAARALAEARARGLTADPGAFDRAANYLAGEQGKVEAGDVEMRSMIQHALATMGRGGFEAANALNRSRQSMNDAALAELALTFAVLGRATIAGEILDILAARARTEAVGPGEKPRTYWAGSNQRWHRGTAETTALAALAFASARPAAPELAGSVEWLLAHRDGGGWQPHKAKGAAVAALASYYGRARAADDRYRLVVTVNDVEVYAADVAGATEGKAVRVPRKAIKVGAANRVRFDVEGRGTYGYSVSLTGFARDTRPEQDSNGKTFFVSNRWFLPATPELDGKPLPTGFNSVVNPKPFTNTITQLGLGGRARVQVDANYIVRSDLPTYGAEFLVVEETLPAGATLIEGTLKAGAAAHSIGDGVLTLYYPPGQPPRTIQYEISGYLPGRYRVAPTRLRSAYEPGKQHLGPAADLRILGPGETSDDPYKATPDELLARGKAHFDAGRLAEAAGPLEELMGGYTPKDAVLKDAARMLLTIHIKDYQARKVVQDFEILKEKAPELIIPFDEVAVVARAYRDIGEHERAYLVWRAIVEASYLEDAQVGQVLRSKGRTIEAAAYLLALWREHPDTASITADLFGLSQLLASVAGRAISDPATRTELATAGVTRHDLLLQAIEINQALLALSPTNPMADEISLAQVGAFLELEDFGAVVALSGRYAGLFPKSNFLDSFQYSEALGRFHLGEYDRAIEVAAKISEATYKDASGVDQPSPNKWQAIYILGQIHDARREPGKAVAYYERVADRFTDAAGAVKSLTRKALSLPEVSIVRPAGGDGKPSVKLDHRNVADADVKVYPVDLMRLYLTRRNLDAIAGIDLAGITPLHETTIKLGDGKDFADKDRVIPLPLAKEGAYLVMARGDNLHASGIVLVSPLEVEVLEEADSGRVRVTVRDAATKAPVPKVTVKVIGGDNPSFLTGETDLRGVYVAEGVRGIVTAVARRDPSQYAFYRGKTYVGAPPVPPAPNGQPAPAKSEPAKPDADLGQNVRDLNNANQMRGVERLENRYKGGRKGIQAQEAK